MIRINLLGTPKAKVRHLPRVTMSAPSLRMVSILVVVLAFGGVYFLYWHAQTQHEKIQVDLRDADKQLAALAGVKAAYTQKQKEADALKQKFTVIDQLRANQNGPVQLLNTITQTVNSTDAVWLSKMSDDGKSISMDGTALSTTAVANLISNLKRSGYFKNVELKETAQDETVKDYQSFTFTLVCEKQHS
jgi:Tfp pilus assembly protein PilN